MGSGVGALLEQLSGIFAFVLYDEERDAFLIARDPIGVIPLYIGYGADGTVYVASELKALEGQCERQRVGDGTSGMRYEPFPPGHYLWSEDLRVMSEESACAVGCAEANSSPFTLHSSLPLWQLAILRSLDRSEISGFSEFETYGNYALAKRSPILRPWQQKRLKRKYIADYDTLCRKYAQPYRWTLTFPDYMKQ